METKQSGEMREKYDPGRKPGEGNEIGSLPRKSGGLASMPPAPRLLINPFVKTLCRVLRLGPLGYRNRATRLLLFSGLPGMDFYKGVKRCAECKER